MTEIELKEIADSFYRRKGKELNAIDAYSKLLDQFPNNAEAWSSLSSMQMQIGDYDNSIKSINIAIDKDPNNSFYSEQKLTLLSAISRLNFSEGYYLNEQTKEAFKIDSYTDNSKLYIDICQIIERQLLSMKENNLLKFRLQWKYALNLKKTGNLNKTVSQLKLLKESIPNDFTNERKNRELAQIYREIGTNYFSLNQIDTGKSEFFKAFELGLDDYYRLGLAKLYQSNGKKEEAKEELHKLIVNLNEKLKSKPEVAFIIQKFEAYKLLSDESGIAKILSEFKKLEPLTENQKKQKEKLEIEIKATYNKGL